MSYGMNNSQSTGMQKEKIPSGYKKGAMQQFTPEQMQLFQQLFSHVSPDSYLSKLAGGDQSLFDEIEAPALRQFQELQGQLGSRFSGMGMGGRKSSGFQNTMNQAGSDFAQSLQSQRQSLQQQAIKDLMGMSNNLMGQKPYENFLYEKQKNPWGMMAGKLTGPVGGFVGDLATGDKSWSGTQAGVDTSMDLIKAFMGSAGKGGGF